MLSDLIGTLGPDYEVVVFRLLPKDLAVRTFEYLPRDIQEGLLRGLGDKRATTILEEMSPDDRTVLLEERGRGEGFGLLGMGRV